MKIDTHGWLILRRIVVVDVSVAERQFVVQKNVLDFITNSLIIMNFLSFMIFFQH